MGTKRKIPITKLETKQQIAVAFSKRRKGLYSKVADLCLHSGARVAVLLNPPSSNAVFHSFGYPDADLIIDAFLEGGVPKPIDEFCSPGEKRKRQGHDIERESTNSELGFWWEKDFDHRGCDELRSAMDELRELRNNVAEKLNSKNPAAPSHHGQDQNNVEKKPTDLPWQQWCQHSSDIDPWCNGDYTVSVQGQQGSDHSSGMKSETSTRNADSTISGSPVDHLQGQKELDTSSSKNNQKSIDEFWQAVEDFGLTVEDVKNLPWPEEWDQTLGMDP